MDKKLQRELLMKQVLDIGKQLFICLEEDSFFFDDIEEKVNAPVYKNGLALWSLSGTTIALFHKAIKREKLKIIRYLDYFYLLVPIVDPISRKKLFNCFFSVLGEDYMTLIDVDRNKENIRYLLSLISYFLPTLKGSRIVDYGCGTGISIDIARSYGINVIGFDSCPIMLNIAKRRGMTVWTEEDMYKQQSDSVDAVFSSYVFHLLPEDKNLQILFNLLKFGSVLVVNFHKCFGIKWANRYLIQLGFRISSLPHIKLCKRHGLYNVYIKPK